MKINTGPPATSISTNNLFSTTQKGIVRDFHTLYTYSHL